MTEPPLASRTPGAATADDLARWARADEEARPARLARLRDRLVAAGVDAYLGVSRENTRYLTGFALAEGEERVAGDSGRFLVGADEVIVLADSRYRQQAEDECPGASVEESYGDLPERWPGLVTRLRALGGGPPRRVAVEANLVSRALWEQLQAAAPDIELVAGRGWVEELRAVKEPAELERVGAACAVADAALQRLLPSIRAGVPERELALQLEWDVRTHGAEALAFDVTCLSGPRAALPHGSPGDRRVRMGEALLFDFGAQVGGYRSDMTRTLFVGAPSAADEAIHDLVHRAQEAAFELLLDSAARHESPTGVAVDAAARDVIEREGHGAHFGHGLGHGIGLATHEVPSISWRAVPAALPWPTVFSIEPGVYLPGRTGVRIEDLVAFDPGAGIVERLTGFPRGPMVVGE
ncbi:MAG TPA: Xaa-Pro peptidase family protein [Candidatus Acidoferrales bacterium]|nr:Xaa-Pro peptidase family protein [Candidatus Acidoferrales bacterium]